MTKSQIRKQSKTFANQARHVNFHKVIEVVCSGKASIACLASYTQNMLNK